MRDKLSVNNDASDIAKVECSTTSTIKWIRLQDGAGNWSRWFIA